MNWFKRNPFIGLLILATVLVLGVEAWLLQSTGQQAHQTALRLKEKIRERDALQRRIPTLNELNEKSITHELANLREKLIVARAALAGGLRSQSATAVPVKSVDAYFDLAAFVESMRLRAIHAQVKIRPDERFGFGSHAREGPALELVETAFQQRVAVEFLVNALMEARPEEFFSLRRENPSALIRRAEQISGAGGVIAASAAKSPGVREEASDFFEMPDSSSIRKAGEISTQAFALEFSGQTLVLRLFLNRLLESEIPVIVRSVEVEPIQNHAKGPPINSSTTTTSVPVVAQNSSRFTVILEVVSATMQTERAAL